MLRVTQLHDIHKPPCAYKGEWRGQELLDDTNAATRYRNAYALGDPPENCGSTWEAQKKDDCF